MKRNIEKILYLWVTVLLVLVIANSTSCLGAQEQITPHEVVITMWDFPHFQGVNGEPGGHFLDWDRAKAAEFEKLHPQVKINLTLLTWGEGALKIDMAVVAGDWPNISMQNPPFVKKYQRLGVLEPIDPVLTEEDIADFGDSLNLGKIGGEHYLFPWNVFAGACWVNRTIFKERGISNLLPEDPKREWTYEQFLKAAQATTFDRDGDGTIDTYGFAINFADSKSIYFRDSFVWNHGGRIYTEDGTRSAVNSTEAAKGFQFLADLFHEYKVMPNPLTLQRDQLRTLFFDRTVAMIFDTMGSKSGYEELVTAGKIKREEFDLFPVRLPHAPNCEDFQFAGGSGYYVFKEKDPYKRLMALEFARYLTNKENIKAVKYVLESPSRKSAGNLYPGDPIQAFIGTLTTLYHPDIMHPLYYEVGATIAVDIYQGMMVQAISTKEALRIYEKKVNDLLEQKESQ